MLRRQGECLQIRTLRSPFLATQRQTKLRATRRLSDLELSRLRRTTNPPVQTGGILDDNTCAARNATPYIKAGKLVA